MLRRIRPKLTYANVMASLAFFLALSGGTAYAINEWTGANIQDGSLTGADVRGANGTSTTAAVNGSLGSGDVSGQPAIAAVGQPFVNGTLTTWDIDDGSLRTDDIRDNTLTGSDVNESTLGKVPDADKLDGIDSTGFQKAGTAPISRAYEVSRDEVTICGTSGCNASLTLTGLPVGSYAIFAKVEADSSNNVGAVQQGTCTLTAGSDTDRADSGVIGGDYRMLPLQLLHTFDSTGQVGLTCFPINTTYRYGKITAIELGQVTKTVAP